MWLLFLCLTTIIEGKSGLPTKETLNTATKIYEKAPLDADWYAESNKPYAYRCYFGWRIAVGDFNGDGYKDIAISAPDYTHDEYEEGAVFVWYGISTGIDTNGDPSNCDWIAEGNQRQACLGYGLAVGDFNGDGYDDIAVGAPYYDDGEIDEGVVFIWYGSANGLGLNGNPVNCDKVLQIDIDNAYFGHALTTGDFDNDGYDDLACGADGYSSGEPNEGAVCVYYGSENGLSSIGWLAESNQNYAYLGYALSSGDFNGDGYDDLACSAPYFDRGEGEEGVVFVWHGSASGLNNGTSGDTTNYTWIAESDQVDAKLGYALSSGDFNGDGYDDIACGVPYFDRGETDEGVVFVWHGSAVGLNNGTNGDTTNYAWITESNQEGAELGYRLAVGNFNGDGYDDIAVGAPNYDDGETNEGAVFVWNGSASGLNNFYAWKAESNQSDAYMHICTAGDINNDGYDEIIVGVTHYSNGENEEGVVFLWEGSSSGPNNGANGFPTNCRWMAESNQEYISDGVLFGYSVAYGDFNGDGFKDIAVSSPHYSNGESEEGAVFVWYGTSSGFEERISGNPSNCDWMAESNQNYAYLGGGYFSGGAIAVGDFNGDGYDDLACGAYCYDNGETDEGAVFVWYGSSSGLNNGVNGDTANCDWRAEPDQSYAYMGTYLTVGDFNGDGYDDLACGAAGFDRGETDEGVVFIWYGSLAGLNNGTNGDATNYAWIGESNQSDANLGYALASGDFNGDGYEDVAVGAPYYDDGETNEGALFVWCGSADGVNNGVNGNPSNTVWQAESNQSYAQFGYAIASGDFNGDGYDDIAISTKLYDDPETEEGAVFVWYGSSSGLGWSGNPANCDWQAESNQQKAHLGKIAIGDFNGDGYDDIIIGAKDYSFYESGEGGIFVWLGSAAGLGENGSPSNCYWYKEGGQESAQLGIKVQHGRWKSIMLAKPTS